MQLNPMGISGVWQGNYQQPDVVAHPVSSQVASYSVGTDALALGSSRTPYSQPLASSDAPGGFIVRFSGPAR